MRSLLQLSVEDVENSDIEEELSPSKGRGQRSIFAQGMSASPQQQGMR